MPISQERLLALLSAAEDFQQALARSSTVLQDQWNRCQAGEQSPEDALRNCLLLTEPQHLLQSPIDSSVAIASERSHMNPARQRENLRRKIKRQREKTVVDGRGFAFGAPAGLGIRPLGLSDEELIERAMAATSRQPQEQEEEQQDD